jgi:hypothetical protein
MFAHFLKYIAYFLSLFYQEHILVIGDSEAAHVSHFYDYVIQPREVVNSDFKGGTVIQQWFGERLDKALTKYPETDTVVIFLGTNNAGRKDELDVSPILDKVKDKKCIWAGPVAVNGHKQVFNQLLKNFILSHSKCKYIDSELLPIKLADGYHPEPQSSIIWLKEVWRVKDE